MNVQWFARLAQRLSGEVGRRQTFTLVGGTLAAALLNRESVAAGCKKAGRKCDKNKDCCDGARCKGDRKDKKGKCRCKSGRKECGGKCKNLDTDANHCGSCNNACPSFLRECIAGTCRKLSGWGQPLCCTRIVLSERSGLLLPEAFRGWRADVRRSPGLRRNQHRGRRLWGWRSVLRFRGRSVLSGERRSGPLRLLVRGIAPQRPRAIADTRAIGNGPVWTCRFVVRQGRRMCAGPLAGVERHRQHAADGERRRADRRQPGQDRHALDTRSAPAPQSRGETMNFIRLVRNSVTVVLILLGGLFLVSSRTLGQEASRHGHRTSMRVIATSRARLSSP